MGEKVVLVAVQRQEKDSDFDYSLRELERLTETAGGEVVSIVVQKRDACDVRTMIGKGKMQELVAIVDETKADTIVFQNELSPSQVRNIQEEIDCKVLDRVQLILDIFAMRAKSKEGKLQVELAQLNYLLPRLSGQGKNMSRLGGGIGTRGPGETKLESDKRHIQSLIQECKKQLEEVKNHRQRARENRKKGHVFQIGLIGYTNAGKSTLLNRLTDAKTYEKDQLFATLDPLTRQCLLKDLYTVTLTDTVGFIQDIPTQLIHAFESTLEESSDVDMLIHVVDSSAENYAAHEQTVLQLLKELKMEKIPLVTVYNKRDSVTPLFTPIQKPSIQICANDDADIQKLQDFIWQEMTKRLIYYEKVFALGQENVYTRFNQETFVVSNTFDEKNLKYVLKGYGKPMTPLMEEYRRDKSSEYDLF